MRSPWRIGHSGNVGGPKDANRTWGPEESRGQVVKMGLCPRRGGLREGWAWPSDFKLSHVPDHREFLYHCFRVYVCEAGKRMVLLKGY